MAKIRKKPTEIYRLWRWESEFNEAGESMGNIEKKMGFCWTKAGWSDLAKAVNGTHKLAVCIRAVCMNDSDTWGVSEDFYPDQPLKVNEIESFYFEQRNGLLSGIQKAHIVDVGWVIQTYSQFKQVDNENWWQIGSIKASKERQQLWRYYHNVIKKLEAA